MNPVFKTDLWTVANAASGRRVYVQLSDWPTSTADYIKRLVLASEYIGLERINAFYDEVTDTYHVGSGKIRLCRADALSTFYIGQFPDNDITDLIDGKHVLDRAQDLLIRFDEGEDLMTEHFFNVDDDNDNYRL